MNQVPPDSSSSPAERIVVVMPNWLGDGVMATPFLRALRAAYPQAYIAALGLPILMPVLAGLPLLDEAHEYRRDQPKEALAWLRGGHFDIAYILPNSFRSAWMIWRRQFKRRIGYARGGRGWLLTTGYKAQRRSSEEFQEAQQRRRAQAKIANDLRHSPAGGTPALRNAGVPPAVAGSGRHPIYHRLGQRLWPVRGYKPVPTIEYYLRLLENPSRDRKGATQTCGKKNDGSLPDGRGSDWRKPEMTLALTDAERAEAHQVRASQGIDPAADVVILVPGANFGSSKCWPPERFAQVADILMDRQGPYRATVLLAGAPAEKPIIDAIMAASQLAARGRLIALTSLNGGRGVSLGCVKALVAQARLMICNDTGPRHFACALGVPVVTLFGPTDPIWAETFYDKERQVRLTPPPSCGPCQLKRCPIDHRCMMGLEVVAVLAAVAELWSTPQKRGPDEP